MTTSSTTSGELAKPQPGTLRAGVGRRVARPHDGAVAGVERVQDAGRAQRVDAAVAEGRRPARTGAAIRFPEPGRVAVPPHRLAGGQAVAGDDLVVAALLLGVEEIAADREGRPARPDRPAPHLDRRRLRPVGLDPHAANDAVALRPAKARPLGCASSRYRWSAAFSAVGSRPARSRRGVAGWRRVRRCGAGSLRGCRRDRCGRCRRRHRLVARPGPAAVPRESASTASGVRPAVAGDAAGPHEREHPHASRMAATIDARRVRSERPRVATAQHDEREAQDRDRRRREHHPHHPVRDRRVNDALGREHRDDHQRRSRRRARTRRAAEEQPPHEDHQPAGDPANHCRYRHASGNDERAPPSNSSIAGRPRARRATGEVVARQVSCSLSDRHGHVRSTPTGAPARRPRAPLARPASATRRRRRHETARPPHHDRQRPGQLAGREIARGRRGPARSRHGAGRDADRHDEHALREHAGQQMPRRRADRQPHAELARARADREREHAGHADHRDQQRDAGESGKRRTRSTAPGASTSARTSARVAARSTG